MNRLRTKPGYRLAAEFLALTSGMVMIAITLGAVVPAALP